jgi:transposase InsO family protein
MVVGRLKCRFDFFDLKRQWRRLLAADARRKLEKWRRDYNQQHPHGRSNAGRICQCRKLNVLRPERAKDLTQVPVCVESFK